MKTINAVIVEDEVHSIASLRSDINLYCPEISIIGEAQSVSLAVKTIDEKQPDLIFLDINLGDGTGFDLLEKVTYRDFKVIFVTAYDQYALRAFKISAIDFLLKPISPTDLIHAVHKFSLYGSSQNFMEQLKILQQGMMTLQSHEKKIVLREQDVIHFVRTADIIRCESEGPYTHFFLTNGKKLTISKNLKEYEEMLSDFGFVRVHHSHLVNFDKVIRLEKFDGGSLLMENNDHIPIAQRKKEQIMDMLKWKFK